MDAMINVQRFYKILREDGQFEIERTDGEVALRFREADPALRGLRHNADFVIGMIVRGCRELTREAICPIRAEFMHAEPTEEVEYADILGCPVKFQAEWTTLIYDEETTRLPVQGANAKLLPVLELACQKVLGPPTAKGQDLVREVRQLIIERLPTASTNFDAIAEVLKMSSKTLERRLGERGQSFSALLDATRYETVKHYLEETDMGLSQVAYMAGYTDPATLVRAFKRWTGDTPMQFREKRRDSARPT
jgi:AraC-like DNA-binding protein